MKKIIFTGKSEKSLCNKFVWETVFHNEEDVNTMGSMAFNSERWLKQLLRQLIEYKDSKDNLPPRASDLPVISNALDASSILDFGGSNGWSFEYISRSCPEYFKSIKKFVVYEEKNVCQYFEKNNLHDLPLIYSNNPETIGTVEIFYSNSTIQYLLDENLLNKCIQKSNPSLILFENVLCGDFQDYYTLQNYYEYKIPVKFRSKKNFIHNLEKLGYELKLLKVYPEPIRGIIGKFDMSNFPKDLRVDYGLTMIFEKVSKK